jgi:hypothetical protein
VLGRLHPEIRVLAQRPGAAVAAISGLRGRYAHFPEALAELMQEATELELSYRGRYLRLYGPSHCIEMDEAYSISVRIPGAIAIGDNGGGEAIVFLPGKGIHRTGYGALDPDEVQFVAGSLEELLVEASVAPEAVGGCRA